MLNMSRIIGKALIDGLLSELGIRGCTGDG